MAYSSSAQGINGLITLLAHNLTLQAGSYYTENPVLPPTPVKPIVQPDNRGFYSADDLAFIASAYNINSGASPELIQPNLSNPAPVDPGDNNALYGRPDPSAKNVPDPNAVPGGGLTPPNTTTGFTAATTGSTNASTTGTTGINTTTAITAGSTATGSTSTTGTTSTTSTTGGSTGTSGTTGIIDNGASGAHAGSSFPWEGTRAGGGSEFASGQVNTQTGNRLTTVPIVGWKARGGVPFGLTLFHNSQDSLDVGWGKGWRSNIDFTVTNTGLKQGTYWTTATVAYPDGRRLVFTYRRGNPQDTISGAFYPPTGFYDVLFPIGTPNQPPIGWTLRTKSQMTYTFDNHGKLTSYRDRYNNAVTISKIAYPAETRIISPDGSYISLFNYTGTIVGSSGIIGGPGFHYGQVAVPGTRVWDFTYNGRSSANDIVLNTITYPTLNGARPYEFFASGYSNTGCAPITTETDVLGRIWRQTYDANNRLKTFQLPVNANASTDPVYTYNYNSASTEFVQPSGKSITEYYDGGLLTSIKDQGGFYNYFKYDQYYNVVQSKDAKMQTSYFVYDAFANLLSSQDPKQYAANVKQQTVYNSWNDVLSTVDCRGVSTYYNRGSIPGTLVSVVDGKGNTLVTNTYNSDGSLATTSSQGVTTQIGYDTHGWANGVTTPDGVATIIYASNTERQGKPISVTTRLGTSTFDYDAWGRLTSTTRFDNATASVLMNAIGYVSTATDVLGHPTALARDGVGRVTQVTNARGDVENYFFNNDGQLYQVENGNQKYRNYFYTPRSELGQISFADGNVEQYLYDGNGNQTQRINGMFQTVTYGYDNVDNLTSVTYPTGTPTTFTYDSDGRQMTMNDSTGTSSWQYDNADNVIQLTTPQGVMNYTYDVWNRNSTLTEGTKVTTYGFTANKLTSISKPTEGVSTTLQYDSYGRLQTKNDGATQTTYGYDANDRVNSIVHSYTNTSTAFHQETYNYDPANNLQSKVVNSVATNYTYDNIDQLLTENGGSIQGSFYVSDIYSYDHNGNRVTKQSAIGGLQQYTYDDADKLQQITKPSGNVNYTYDNCGRTSTIHGPSGTKTFTWDYEDRLTNLSGGGVTNTNYGYNGLGSRTSKSNANGSRTYKRNGVGVTAPVLSDGVSTMVPGISESSGGGTNFVHTDRLGSMKAVSSGSVTDTAEYDAFGKVILRTGTSATQKGFASGFGYQEDGESGYKLLGHRYYDPESGRFLSRDPAQDGRNWYSYVDNNPLKAVDSEGLYAVIIIMVNGGVGSGAHAIIGLEVKPGVIYWFGYYGDGKVIMGDAPKEGDSFTAVRKELTKEQYETLAGIVIADYKDSRKGKLPKGKYHLITNNCSSYIWSVLCEAGIVVDESGALQEKMTPADLIRFLDGEGVGFSPITVPPSWRRKPGKGGSSSSHSSGS